MYTLKDIAEVIRTSIAMLFFKTAIPDMKRLGYLYLGMGLVFAWLAGIGRHWDNARADQFQQMGLGSIAYVFAFSFFLWLLLWPLKPRNWSYFTALTFIAMTSPPALLYALPGRFLSPDQIPWAKVFLLAIVAIWRVALLVRFLKGSANFHNSDLSVAVCLPLSVIVTVLVILNLDHAVFEVMGGQNPTENDGAFFVLLLLSTLSVFAAPILVLMYGFKIWKRSKSENNEYEQV